MKRSLILLVLILGSVTFSRGQLYTGGKGNGATMSCVPPKVTTLGEDLEIRCVTSDEIVLAVYASGSDLQYVWQKFKIIPSRSGACYSPRRVGDGYSSDHSSGKKPR